jgi:hypothetical protein
MARKLLSCLVGTLVAAGAAPLAAQPRETLVDGSPKRVASYTAAELEARVARPEANSDPMFQGIMRMPSGKALLALAGTGIKCGVDIWSMQYTTVGGAGEPTMASGAVMVPTGGAGCTGSRPTIVYARSASMQRNINIADLDQNYLGEPELLAALFAGQGYITIATNYAGYDTSPLPYHPYLNADQQSKDMIDSLAAGQALLRRVKAAARGNGQLLISGYSQGGYVAMATHRAMQQLGMTVTASASGAGPYAMGLFGDNVFRGTDFTPGDTFQLPLLITSYQKAYGDLYVSPADLYNPQFAQGIETLLPSVGSPGVLFKTGRLPPKAVFSRTPPAASAGSDMVLQRALQAVTPPATGGPADAIGARSFGDPALIGNTARAGVLLDAMAHPDGAALSATGVGMPSATAENPLRRAFARNDLRSWTPQSPVLMCSMQSNPWVSYHSHQQLLADLWAELPAGRITSIDLEALVLESDSDALRMLKVEFAASRERIVANAVDKGATDGGAAALREALHHWLGQPLCMVATLGFFDNVLNNRAK